MSRRFLHILAVEDDPDIRTVIKLALELDADISAVVAGSGSEALQRLDEGPPPDLVLIDDQLPDTDGVTLIAALREAGHGELRYAFLTASTRDADRSRFVATGVVGVLAKPFDPLILAQEIRALLVIGQEPSST